MVKCTSQPPSTVLPQRSQSKTTLATTHLLQERLKCRELLVIGLLREAPRLGAISLDAPAGEIVHGVVVEGQGVTARVEERAVDRPENARLHHLIERALSHQAPPPARASLRIHS